MNHNHEYELEGAMSKLTVNFIGDIFCDIIVKGIEKLPTWGTDTLAQTKIIAGGSCLNSIVHAKGYLQHSLSSSDVILNLFSSVASDAQGTTCLSLLNSHGLSINNIKIVDDSAMLSTGTCIVISGKDDRCFISDRGCIKEQSISWFSESNLYQCSHLHLGGFYNCDKLIFEARDLFKKAKEQNITTSLNPQYDASMQWLHIEEVCPFLDLLIGNQDEIVAIGKMEDPIAAASQIIDWGCKCVILTLGSGGAMACIREANNCHPVEDNTRIYNPKNATTSQQKTEIKIIHVDACSVDRELIVDTTGAGDAFLGAFLVSWAQTKDMKASLHAGCISGAAAIQVVGGSTINHEYLANSSIADSICPVDLR